MSLVIGMTRRESARLITQDVMKPFYTGFNPISPFLIMRETLFTEGTIFDLEWNLSAPTRIKVITITEAFFMTIISVSLIIAEFMRVTRCRPRLRLLVPMQRTIGIL